VNTREDNYYGEELRECVTSVLLLLLLLLGNLLLLLFIIIMKMCPASFRETCQWLKFP